MEQIGALIARVLAAPDDDRVIGMVRTEVESTLSAVSAVRREAPQ